MESDDKVVHILEWRAHSIFMHWFQYVISGLYDLSEEPKPVKFHTSITEDFQRETLRLLTPDYEFIENLEGYTKISHFGAPCKTLYSVEDHYYHFVREQILIKNNLEINTPPFRRIYLRRSRTPMLKHHGNYARRTIMDEDKLVEVLETNGYECLFLEDYSLCDKIRLFQEAELIVSPNGGALTGCYFSHKDSHIVILSPKNPGEQHYFHLCNVLSIPNTCYDNLKFLDKDGKVTTHFGIGVPYSMQILDYDHLLNFLETIKPSQRSNEYKI